MENQEMIVVTCQHCDGRMVEAMVDDTGVIKKIAGFLAFLVGLGLLNLVPNRNNGRNCARRDFDTR